MNLDVVVKDIDYIELLIYGLLCTITSSIDELLNKICQVQLSYKFKLGSYFHDDLGD